MELVNFGNISGNSSRKDDPIGISFCWSFAFTNILPPSKAIILFLLTTYERLTRIKESCITCSGRGYIKTAETICFELFREIMREARQYETNELLVLASQPVVDLLLDEESTSLAELEDYIGKTIKLQVESLYSQEQFDVVPL